MLYLLLAVALCLLVPWLPILMYRRLPRRPAPPLADWQLQRLADELRPGHAAATAGTSAAGGTESAVAPAWHGTPDDRGEAEPQTRAEGRSIPAPADRPRRLSMGSYRWVNRLAVPVLPAAMLAIAFGLAVVFHFLGEARARSLGPAVFLITPAYGLICGLPAVFLGIFTAIPVIALLTRLLLGRRRFREFLFWDEGRIAAGHGITPEGTIHLLSCMALPASVLCAVFVWFALNQHTRFTEEEIVIRRLFAFREDARPYDSVEQIVQTTHEIRDREIVPRQNVYLRFKDGQTWDRDSVSFGPADGAELEHFLDFLQAKTGKPILRARLIRDVPGW